MNPRLFTFVLASSLLLVACVAATKAPRNDGQKQIDWVGDRTCQLVFHAVLEGLYADGVENDVVDRVLDIDPKTKTPKFETHFVYCCPLCHPAFEAFRLYKCRPDFYGRKDSRDSFGPGLEPSLRLQLTQGEIKERLSALHQVIERWVKTRLDSMRLTAAEKQDWAERLAIRRKLGMESLEKSSFAGKAAGFKGCAICDGSAGACPLR